MRWTIAALGAIQEATEQRLTSLFEDARLCTIHAKRVDKDIQLVRRIQDEPSFKQ